MFASDLLGFLLSFLVKYGLRRMVNLLMNLVLFSLFFVGFYTFENDIKLGEVLDKVASEKQVEKAREGAKMHQSLGPTGSKGELVVNWLELSAIDFFHYILLFAILIST